MRLAGRCVLRSSDTGLGGAASHTHPNELQIPAATRNESNIHVIRIDQPRLLLPDHVRHPLTHGNGAASAHPPRTRLVKVRVRARGRGIGLGYLRVEVLVGVRVSGAFAREVSNSVPPALMRLHVLLVPSALTGDSGSGVESSAVPAWLGQGSQIKATYY